MKKRKGKRKKRKKEMEIGFHGQRGSALLLRVFLTVNMSSLFTNKYIPNLVVGTCFPRTSMTCYDLVSQAPALFPCRHLIQYCLVKNYSIILHLQNINKKDENSNMLDSLMQLPLHVSLEKQKRNSLEKQINKSRNKPYK